MFKTIVQSLGVVTAALAIAGCNTQTPPPVPAKPTLITVKPTDFKNGVWKGTFKQLLPNERLLVIPVQASQGLQEGGLSLKFNVNGVQSVLAPLEQRMPQSTAPNPYLQKHLEHQEHNFEMVKELQKKAVPLALQKKVKPQAAKCAEQLNQNCAFWVLDPTDNQQQIQARMLHTSAHANWFVQVEDLETLSLQDIQNMAKQYETVTVPTLKTYFGELPDVDQNGKVNVIFSHLLQPNLLGYVFYPDFFSDADTMENWGIHSNEGDYFYAVTPPEGGDAFLLERLLPSTLTHELKHLIAAGERIVRLQTDPEDAWAEEPSAMAAQELAGQGTQWGVVQPYAEYGLRTPEDFRITQIYPPNDYQEAISMYGYNFLFMWSVAEKVGHKNFWKNWTQSNMAGILNLEKHAGQNIEDLMLNWAKTLAFDHTGIFNGVGYTSLNLRDGNWMPLGIQGLTSRSVYVRSAGYYMGQGKNTDAQITITNLNPNQPAHIMVARFPAQK